MEATSGNTTRSFLTDDEKLKELKEFDETKVGVKGLIDSGVHAKISNFYPNPNTCKIF